MSASTTTTLPPPSAVYMPALDGLRGLAVLMVMFFHFTLYPPIPSRAVFPLFALASYGWAGVDVFFVLSGFLITGILFDARGTPHALRNFYLRRALRIFPLYYGVLTLLLVVAPLLFAVRNARSAELFQHQAWLWTYTSNILSTIEHRTLFASDWLWLNHLWSVSIEEQFYLAWPLLVLTLNRRALMAICVAAVPLAFAFRLAMQLEGNALGGYLFTACRIDGLAIGALLALFVRGSAGFAPVRRWALRYGGAVFVALIWLFYRRFGPRLNFNDPLVQLYGYPLLAICAACVIALTATECEHTLLGRMLTRPALLRIGRYSYGVYVFHMILQPLCLRFASSQILGGMLGNRVLGLFAHLSLAFGLSIAVAALSYHVYEQQFLRLKRFFRSEPVR